MDIRVEGLRFERSGRVVLSIDALSFPSGETTAVLGRNGAGKTTLLRLLSGISRPGSGSVFLGGEEVKGPAKATAFALQSPVFLRGSVRYNLELALSLRGGGKGDLRSRAEGAAPCRESACPAP